MTEKSFKVDMLAVEKVLYEGEAVSLVIPSEYGYMGVLANHAPLIAAVSKGRIVLRGTSGKTDVFYSKGGGFIEFSKNKATIILDTAVDLQEQSSMHS